MEMRRQRSPQASIAEFNRLQAEGTGLALLLAQLGPDASPADALRMHRKIAQMSRRACSFLDEELGIVRD
jgi:hypothetical protein